MIIFMPVWRWLWRRFLLRDWVHIIFPWFQIFFQTSFAYLLVLLLHVYSFFCCCFFLFLFLYLFTFKWPAHCTSISPLNNTIVSHIIHLEFGSSNAKIVHLLNTHFRKKNLYKSYIRILTAIFAASEGELLFFKAYYCLLFCFSMWWAILKEQKICVRHIM